MNKVKVGVIGTGHLGRFHSLNYAQIPQAELVGVYDMDMEKANKVAEESQSKAFESVAALLSEVDAVTVAVPTDKHYESVKEVFEHNVHCMVEKPIMQSLEEADELIKVANEKSLIFQVGQIERFNPAIASVQAMGLAPQFIEAHRLAPFNPRGTEVSVILDLMIHDIDAILSTVKSPIVNLDASGVAVVSDTIDIANARIRFENGTVANLTASRISQKTMRKMRFFQKDTYITVDFHQKMAEVFRLDTDVQNADMVLGEIGVGENKKQVIYQKPQPVGDNALRAELEAFLSTIQGEDVPCVTAVDGREALAVALQVIDCM